MKLHVLAGGDVAEAARVALTDFGQRVELIAGENPLRNLHAQHLRVFSLALPVRAAHEAERPPLVGRHLSALVAFECFHELVDVGDAGERKPRPAEGFGIIYNRHEASLNWQP